MLSESSKSSLWQSVHVFLKVINGFENRRLKNPFVMNPYMEYKRYAYKYIPEDVLKRLDVVFYIDEIELKFRLIYWLLRLLEENKELKHECEILRGKVFQLMQ